MGRLEENRKEELGLQKTTTNRRCGENHPRATCTDRDVELARQLYDEHPIGHPEHLGYKALARIMGVPVRTIRDWVTYRHR